MLPTDNTQPGLFRSFLDLFLPLSIPFPPSTIHPAPSPFAILLSPLYLSVFGLRSDNIATPNQTEPSLDGPPSSSDPLEHTDCTHSLQSQHESR